MEGLTLGVTDGSVETDEKALLWIFWRKSQTAGIWAMANRAMSGVGGIFMRCFLSSHVTVYVLTDFVPLNNVVVTISLCEMLDWGAAVLNIKQGSPTWCILNFHFDHLNTSLKICVGYFCDWLVCQMRGRWQCQGDRWKWTGRQWEGKKVSELKLCFKKNMKCKKEIMPNSQSQEDRWKWTRRQWEAN